LAMAFLLVTLLTVPGWAAAQSDATAPITPANAISAPAPAVTTESAASAPTDDPAPQAVVADPPRAVQSDEPAVDARRVPTFFRDEYHMWTGPFHPGNYDSHSMRKYGIPFLLISGAALATDRYSAKWLPNTNDQVLWSGRVSQLGAPYTLAGVTGGAYLLGRF